MADVSRHSSGMAGHPDAAEMRERYARLAEGRRVEMLEGLVMLTGLYLAISPWILHFQGTNASMRVNNLVLGLAMAAIGLGLAMFPERSTGLSWMLIPIGVWLIISPWVASAGHSAPKGIIWNNIIVGALACVLGAVTGAMTLMRRRPVRAR
jgi:apolipoprotein N-acyltransferase